MLCHGGSILGKSYIGLGNSTLDIQALFEDSAKADGLSGKLPFTFSNVRGTNEADGFGVYLLGFRNPDLTLRDDWKDLGLHDDTCCRRARVVAAEEEADHVLHRRDRRPRASGR